MGLYLLIVDVTVCEVTPVILHGVVFPDRPLQRYPLQGYLAHKSPPPSPYRGTSLIRTYPPVGIGLQVP